jgi:NAD+ synthase
MSKNLSLTLAQINPTVGDLQGNSRGIKDIVQNYHSKTDLILFPELSLVGYTPEDLLLKNSFLDDVEKTLADLIAFSNAYKVAFVIGAPFKDKKTNQLFNAAHVIEEGRILATRFKHKLPNYGVFDEHRYFTAGELPMPIPFRGLKLGLMICEDLWSPDVSDHLNEKGADLLLAINGSPFDPEKHYRRLHQCSLRALKARKFFAYVNQVGGQDDLVYDGGSFLLNDMGQRIHQSAFFTEDISTHPIEIQADTSSVHLSSSASNFIKDHDEQEWLYQACCLALKDYVHKNGFKTVLLGLSGGIDSAFVATLAVDALGADHVSALMMPSPFTSPESLEDARLCAQNLGICLHHFSIAELMAQVEKDFKSSLNQDLKNLAHENTQSRLRGTILMALSNHSGALVLSTGNKSELATGYATLYGDMNGAFNPIKDLYKTQIYQLAKWRNQKSLAIPERIINKPASAELRPNQTDQDSLPPYEILDEILEYWLESDYSVNDIINEGYDKKLVTSILRLVERSEFKRRQSCIGPKLSPRAFERERRYPITCAYRPPLHKG